LVNLGYLYEEGRGVQLDYASAARLFQMAAEQGSPKLRST
jgi:TPR repeat protein